jgi:hypothetical protein
MYKTTEIVSFEVDNMTNYIYIATSLDGFIATVDDGIDWLNDIPNPESSLSSIICESFLRKASLQPFS